MRTRVRARPRGTDSAPAGATLIEAIVACTLLLVMALAMAASLYLSRGGLTAGRNKRLAIEAANARLEELRGTNYWSLTNLPILAVRNYDLHYLRKNGAEWVGSDVDPGETVLISGRPMPIITTVRYEDIDGGGNSYDCLKLNVAVGYRVNPAAAVNLETLFAP